MQKWWKILAPPNRKVSRLSEVRETYPNQRTGVGKTYLGQQPRIGEDYLGKQPNDAQTHWREQSGPGSSIGRGGE